MDAQIAVNGDGDYALGFTVDGAFIPLATVASHRVGHLVERQATLKAKADDPSHEGHGPACDALETDWKVQIGDTSSHGSGSEGTSESYSELEARIAALETPKTETEEA
jgi:hypothetical protein